MTNNVVPGSITDNYTSRNRVTRPPHVHTWRVLVPRSRYAIWMSPSSIPNWAPVRPNRGPTGAQLRPIGAQPGPTWNAAWEAVGFLVPRSQASFPVPRTCSPFQFFVPPFFVACSQIYHTFIFKIIFVERFPNSPQEQGYCLYQQVSKGHIFVAVNSRSRPCRSPY